MIILLFVVVVCMASVFWWWSQRYSALQTNRRFSRGLSNAMKEHDMAIRKEKAPVIAKLFESCKQTTFIYSGSSVLYSDIASRIGGTRNIDLSLFHELLRGYMIQRLFLLRSLCFDNDDLDEYVAQIFYRLFEFTPIKKDHFVLGDKNGNLYQRSMFVDKKI